MKRASISEVKNGLSSYVDLVRQGETVVITDRGHPVAQMVPPGRSKNVEADERRATLEGRGVLLRASSRAGKGFLERLPSSREHERTCWKRYWKNGERGGEILG